MFYLTYTVNLIKDVLIEKKNNTHDMFTLKK